MDKAGGEAFGTKFNPCLLKILKFTMLKQKLKKTSPHIPFDIQSEIMKRLPVKPLVQFRSVSKQWKSLIDDPGFIKTYHINRTNPQHHLLVSYKLDTFQTYTSIIDNNTFPRQKFHLTAPESLLKYPFKLLGPVNGLLCFCGSYLDAYSKTQMAVIWNPALRKSVGILIPDPKVGIDVVGFGACPDTSDPKLVKITVNKSNDDISHSWVVEVFTLSTRVWKTVYVGAPFKSCVFFSGCQVFVNGVIYFLADEDCHLIGGLCNFIISFDLKSEKFGEVCLPEVGTSPSLDVAKVNESLYLLEYYHEGGTPVCGVWTRKDGEPFTKMYTVKAEGPMFDRVLGFRNNGEALMKMDNDDYKKSRTKIYEPLTGKVNGVVINGLSSFKEDSVVLQYYNNGCRGTFSVKSYMETLILLDQSDSIIYQQR